MIKSKKEKLDFPTKRTFQNKQFLKMEYYLDPCL